MQIPENDQIRKWLENQTKHKNKIESALLFSKGKPLIAAEMIDLEVNETRKDFIKDISELIKTGNNLLQISEQWPKDNESMLLKLEWMSDLLMDCIRHKFLTENQETFMKMIQSPEHQEFHPKLHSFMSAEPVKKMFTTSVE